MKNKRNLILLPIIFLLCSIAITSYIWSKQRKKRLALANAGIWSFSYCYSNNCDLVYTGQFEFTIVDSLKMICEVYAPKSNKPEKITAKNLTYDLNTQTLKGTLVHNRFRIRGDFLKEQFTLLFDDNVLSGTGRCLSNCAEGTDDVVIKWEGAKMHTE